MHSSDSLAWLNALPSYSLIFLCSQHPLNFLRSLCQTPSNTVVFASWPSAHIAMECFYPLVIKCFSPHLGRVRKLLPPQGFPAFLSRNDASLAFLMYYSRCHPVSCDITWFYGFSLPSGKKLLRAQRVFDSLCISPSHRMQCAWFAFHKGPENS